MFVYIITGLLWSTLVNGYYGLENPDEVRKPGFWCGYALNVALWPICVFQAICYFIKRIEEIEKELES